MMPRRRLTTSIVTVTAFSLLAGCATTRQPGGIPFGEWSGRGMFVYETWESGKEAESIHRSYPTRLSIRPLSLDAEEGVELEIVSERGELPELEGDRTHLKVALVEAKRVPTRPSCIASPIGSTTRFRGRHSSSITTHLRLPRVA